MIDEEVQLGAAYFTEVGQGSRRHVERVVILNSDGGSGWWVYCPSSRHRCHVWHASDLSPINHEEHA